MFSLRNYSCRELDSLGNCTVLSHQLTINSRVLEPLAVHTSHDFTSRTGWLCLVPCQGYVTSRRVTLQMLPMSHQTIWETLCRGRSVSHSPSVCVLYYIRWWLICPRSRAQRLARTAPLRGSWTVYRKQHSKDTLTMHHFTHVSI